MKNQKVLVTTEFRGVFYGEVINDKKSPEKMVLKNAKNVIYWSSDCNGFLGLAKTGPTSNCNIGAEVKELTLYKITSTTQVTKEAEKKFAKYK